MVADASQRDRTRKAGGPTSHNNKSDREGCFLSRCMASLGTIGDKVSTREGGEMEISTGCGI